MSIKSFQQILLRASVSLGCLLGCPGPASSTEFTARVVMEKMTAEERYSYLAGIVEGLAYARYASDGKTRAGMQCIYSWFYDDRKTADLIEAAFAQYPDYTPGAVVAVLAKRKCN